jgi:hypothetical protein
MRRCGERPVHLLPGAARRARRGSFQLHAATQFPTSRVSTDGAPDCTSGSDSRLAPAWQPGAGTSTSADRLRPQRDSDAPSGAILPLRTAFLAAQITALLHGDRAGHAGVERARIVERARLREETLERTSGGEVGTGLCAVRTRGVVLHAAGIAPAHRRVDLDCHCIRAEHVVLHHHLGHASLRWHGCS